MNNRVIRLFLFTLLFNLIISVATGAEVRATKNETQNIINRTNAVVATAQRFASEGKKYDGLGLAVSHQLLAKELFSESAYTEAVFHSLRSRVLAAGVIKINKSDLLNEALYDRTEQKFVNQSPSERELDQQLKDSQTVLNDKAAANIELD